MGEWSKEWMKDIDTSKLTPFPIQLANCERLEKNDAVYIFDEVGSGKTISSGLMALHYLYNHREEAEEQRRKRKKSVLIITTNAVLDSEQFPKDWAEKLPFEKLGFQANWRKWNADIKVRNNDYRNLKDEDPDHCYGLVIIDEAHVFLKSDPNKETQRYNQLTERIRAKKVVFLTATPIKKRSIDDLRRYVEIAKQITSKSDRGNDQERAISEETETLWEQITGKETLCARFDPACPVTRYFKDTINTLRDAKYEKSKAVRAQAHIWKYEGGGGGKSREDHKKETLLQEIEGVLKKDNTSRFIIFMRYKDEDNSQSAYAVGAFLKDNEWSKWSPGVNSTQGGERYYAIVTGDGGDLSAFQGEGDWNKLPHVLILTYQKGQEGVNLPGFNYVVNYHIPGDPAALEQRLGRVDRLTGQRHPEIHACYLVDPKYTVSDTNSRNFYSALTLYMQETLPVIQARNALLTSSVIDMYLRQRDKAEKEIEWLRNYIRNDSPLRALLAGKEAEVDSPLREFTKEEEIQKVIEGVKRRRYTDEERIHELREDLRRILSNRIPKRVDDETLDLWTKIVQTTDEDGSGDASDRISDGIFYMEQAQDGRRYDLRTMSFRECAEKVLESGYADYQEMLQRYLPK